MTIDEAALRQSVDALMRAVSAGLQTASLTARMSEVMTAAEELLDVDGVGLMLLDDDDRPRMVATTGPTAEAMEKAQVELGIGPGWDSLCERRTVVVNDLAAEPDYEPLWQRVAGAGVRAVVAAPVWVDGEIAGNLNALTRSARPWPAPEVAAVEAYASVVAALLVMAARREPATMPMREGGEQP